jgi:hypothetical protein
MSYVHYLMKCRKCSEPILLPPPTSHDTHSNQSEWPTGDWRKHFLCVGCKRTHEYSGANVQTEIQDTQSPWVLGECRCWSIRYRCDTENCGLPIETFAVSDTSASDQAMLAMFLESLNSPPLPAARRCPAGHEALAPDHPKMFDAIVCPFPHLT